MASDALQLPVTAALLAAQLREHHAQAAAAVWFAYDACLTIDVEIKNIWRATWTLPKALFLFIRYWGLFSLFCNFAVSVKPNATRQFCSHWLWLSALNMVVLIGGAINLLFLVRLYGLFGRSRAILALLGTLYVVELSMDIANSTMRKPIPVFFIDPSGAAQPGCVNSAFAPLPMIYALQALCLFRAALYFALTLYRTITFIEHGGEASSRRLLHRTRRNLRLGPVIALFLRDEAATFLAILIFQTVLSVVAYTPRLQPYTASVLPFLPPVVAIASTRLVLNLKDTGAGARVPPVSLFVAIPGPDAPIELRTADFNPRSAAQAGTPSPGGASSELLGGHGVGKPADYHFGDVLDLVPAHGFNIAEHGVDDGEAMVFRPAPTP